VDEGGGQGGSCLLIARVTSTRLQGSAKPFGGFALPPYPGYNGRLRIETIARALCEGDSDFEDKGDLE